MRDVGWTIGLLPCSKNCCERSGPKKLFISCHRRAGTHTDGAFDAVLKAVETRQVDGQFDRSRGNFGNSEVVDAQWQGGLCVTGYRHLRGRHALEKGTQVHDEIANNRKVAQWIEPERCVSIPDIFYACDAGEHHTRKRCLGWTRTAPA